MKRPNYSLYFSLVASFLLSLLYCPVLKPLLNDTEVFSYMGLAIAKGKVPYRDFFDHKPPFIYFINYAGVLLGGAWGIWLIDTLLVLLATGIFWQRCRQYRVLLPWLLPLLFNLMLRDHYVCISSDATREFTTIFFLLFFCVFIGDSRHRDWLLGMLTAMVLLTQQEQVLPLIPFLLYDVWTRRRGHTGRPVLYFSAGFAGILVPIILYFAVNQALTAFWQDAFRFNLIWYVTQKKSIMQHFTTIRHVLTAGNYELPVMIALTLGIASLFLRQEKKGLLLAALAATGFALAAEMMGGRYNGMEQPLDFFYYFVPLSAAIPILLFVIFVFSREEWMASPALRLVFAILLCTSVGFTSLQKATHPTRWKWIGVVASPEADYLRKQSPGDYQLFIFFDIDYNYLYNELKILAPSPWIYHHFWWWYDRWDPDGAILHSIGDDLLRHKTQYVLLDPRRLGDLRNPAGADWLLNFMRTWYEPVVLPGRPHSMIWKRKTL